MNTFQKTKIESFIKPFFLGIFSLFVFLFNLITPAFAHEQYVLTSKQLKIGLADKNTNVWAALNNPLNLQISLYVGLGITIFIILYFIFQYSKLGHEFNKIILKLEPLGHILLRVSLAGAFISSAYFHVFLGPEIPLTSIPLGNFWIPILYIVGVLLLIGLCTRIISVIALVILALTTIVYGQYMFTYFNYYGEIIAFIIFGSYVFSLDNKLFGISKLIDKYKDWEIVLIRITYGFSVMYPAITIKLLHPAVIVMIVNQYHLNQIHWLFPQDPLLIALGTGLAQILVGTMIIVGFETRAASLVTFFLYFLSVLYFKEVVWPHYVLLALALYLVINNGGKLTFDYKIGNWLHKKRKSKKD